MQEEEKKTVDIDDSGPATDVEVKEEKETVETVEPVEEKQEKVEEKVEETVEETVARLHLKKVGAKLTRLSKEQADYISVTPEGPYKPDTYRY